MNNPDHKEQSPKVQPPEEFTGIKLKKAKKNAAGIQGIVAALGHANKYMTTGQAVRTMFKLNQQGGVDCPGCAWPDPDDDRSQLGEYCENGVKAIAEEASRKTIGANFFAQYSVTELSHWSDFKLGKSGRLREPMYLPKGASHYQPISWADAFQKIGSHLRSLPDPNQAVFYTSGRTSNEAAFLYQLFVREFGTNNLPDCSNMCHESSGVGLSKTVGIGKGSVTLPDLYEAEVILVIGQNPGTNHPRMLSALERCKENGGKIITINPLPEAGLASFKNPQRPLKLLSKGTPISDLFLPVKINGDIALLKAIMLQLYYQEMKTPGTVFDFDFISAKTEGYEDLITDLKTHDFNELVEQSGVPRDRILAAAEMLRRKTKIIICWAMGLTQHENGVANIREVVNLLLLKGAIGKPGAGTCPVRGHSNVQGDRTVGIWEAPPSAFLDRIEKTYGFQPPQKHGYAVVDAIEAMHNRKVNVFFAMGGNFLSAAPDTTYTAEALQRCQLTVQVSTKLNRSHLIHGEEALILPCLGRTNIDIQASGEQFVSVENSMGVVHASRGILSPPSNTLLSEPAIVAGIAKATLGSTSVINWDDLVANYDLIRDGIEAVVPGFDQYNQRVREPGGFYLPNGARQQEFNTDTGKAKFSVVPIPDNRVPEGQFAMMTIRSHDQYNTTIYGLHDRYRGVFNERRVVLMNREDMKEHDFQVKEIVHLSGVYNGKLREAKQFLVVPYDNPKGCVATYFPEANVLVPIDKKAAYSKTPASKRILISNKKALPND